MLENGGFSTVGLAHAAVLDWIRANAYEISGAALRNIISSGGRVQSGACGDRSMLPG